MSHAAASTREPTRISLRRERLLTLPFACDPRASLPRPLRRPGSPAASLAGVPAPLRTRVGRHLQSTAFPYPQFVQSNGAFAWTEFTIVELENARWRVAVCPDLGGRVLRIFDRVQQRELLLQPPAVNMAVVGLPGAWFIGGVEFNPFRWGHNIHGLSTLETRRVQFRDGTEGVEFGACDELFGCRWQVCLALGAAQVFFRVVLSNLSDEPQPDYWWTTIAVPAHRHTRVLGAPGPMLHHGMFRTGYQHDTWPRLHGRDWSRWPEHHEIASAYLYAPASDFFGYADASDGFTFVHQADRTVCRGRKMWTVGAGRDNAIWSDRLLETASTSYLELQSGLNPLQVENGLLAPGEQRAWTESIGAIMLPGEVDVNGDDYAALFAEFEHQAAAAMRNEFAAHAKADAWSAVEARERLTAASPRVALSNRIVLASESVTAREAAQAAAEGWLGGAAWRRKLAALQSAGELTNAGRLAQATALLDAGDGDAASSLLQTLATDADPAIAGWANYLLGLQTKAIAPLQRATEFLPERGDLWIALDQALAERRRHADRASLWTRAPQSLAARDDVRVAQAAGALARGEWARVRTLLTAPLPTIAEGSLVPWLVFRESFAGEAFARWAAGEREEASRLFFLGGQPAPQFGVGRDEAGWGHDFVYYRWRLACESGRTLEAALLLGQAMQHLPYAGTAAAAYLARLAAEAEHPSTATRLAALRAWDADGGARAASFTPVRTAIVEQLGSGDAFVWQSLADDPVYAHRARFEIARLARSAPAK